MEKKNITISVTPELKECLDKMKEDRYCGASRNAMLRELISAGLSTLEKEDKCIG